MALSLPTTETNTINNADSTREFRWRFSWICIEVLDLSSWVVNFKCKMFVLIARCRHHLLPESVISLHLCVSKYILPLLEAPTVSIHYVLTARRYTFTQQQTLKTNARYTTQHGAKAKTTDGVAYSSLSLFIISKEINQQPTWWCFIILYRMQLFISSSKMGNNVESRFALLKMIAICNHDA